MKIIDVHTHIGLSPDGGHGKLSELLAIKKELGIVKTIVFATDEQDKGVTFELPNQRILEAQNRYPEKLIAFTRIVPSAGKAAVAEFKRCVKAGAQGLKLKTVDGFDPEESRLILDLIKPGRKFPVLMHTAHDQNSQPRRWEPMVADYPHINFILAHGGKDHHKKVAEMALKYPNAYVDTSTLSLNRTRRILDVAGPTKLLFASDYPYSQQSIELKKLEIAVSDKKDLELVLYKNALNLFNF